MRKYITTFNSYDDVTCILILYMWKNQLCFCIYPRFSKSLKSDENKLQFIILSKHILCNVRVCISIVVRE